MDEANGDSLRPWLQEARANIGTRCALRRETSSAGQFHSMESMAAVAWLDVQASRHIMFYILKYCLIY
jgi:hypothetical protein